VSFHRKPQDWCFLHVLKLMRDDYCILDVLKRYDKRRRREHDRTWWRAWWWGVAISVSAALCGVALVWIYFDLQGGN